MKHVFVYILSGRHPDATVNGRLTVHVTKGASRPQRAVLEDLVHKLKVAGITAAPKLQEPHR